MDEAAESTMNRRTVPDQEILERLLEESAARHQHLCPRQVLGVRLGLAGLRQLGLVDEYYRPRFDNSDKRLLTIVETDGCGADGVGIATDCVIGRRTLRVLDYGKVAATLVDTATGRAVRLAPSSRARSLAAVLAPSADSLWHSYMSAYQSMADEELLRIQRVELTRSLAEILSKPGVRVRCQQCGEEIMNEREIRRDGSLLCRSCGGESYYRAI